MDALWMLRKHALHVGDRHMPLKCHAINDGGVAGSELRRYTHTALKGGPVCVVQDLYLAPELLVDLICPFLTAATTWVTVHGNIGCIRCYARKDRQQEDGETSHSIFHVRCCHLASPS
ncbi:hypothetical protein SPHINGOT1_620036 [Sphingomonas sp. T1]|nr:hypothetical protein SPHINGOT1_620036 [Sphingomonas sp. T1]